MNKELEKRLRNKVKSLVENIIKEEGPMEKPKGFKPKSTKPTVPIRVGGARVVYKNGNVIIANEEGTQVAISEEDAVKVANYIIRLSGKA